MPARTNDFQRLVALVQQVLAPSGAIAKESAIVLDETKTTREIDVFLKIQGQECLLRIAVEAKDHKSPMDIGQFESLLGRHYVDGGIPVDHLVVITHRGFAKTVAKRASFLNERGKLITLQRLSEVTATTVRGWSDRFPKQFVLKDLPEIHILSIEQLTEGVTTPELTAQGEIICPHGCHVYKTREYLEGPFYEYVRTANRTRIEHMFRCSERTRMPCVEPWIAPEQGMKWRLGSSEGRISGIVFLVRCTARFSTVHYTDWHLNSKLDGLSKPFTVAEVPFGHEKLRFVMEQTNGLPPKIAIETLRSENSPMPLLGGMKGRVTVCGLDD